MTLHSKKLSKKEKIIIYFISAISAVALAVCVIAVILTSLKKASPYILSSNASNVDLFNSSTVSTVEPMFEYSDPVTIIPTAPTITVTPNKKQNITDIAEKNQQVEQTNENTVIVKNIGLKLDNLAKRKIKLPVNYLAQNPELPTGCEITALTTVLNYYGYDVSKTTMADDFLEKSTTFPANFWKVFLGNPRSPSSFGCYAQPITNAANKYFATQGARHQAVNLSGQTFEKLLKEVENGYPIVIWGTMYSDKTKTLREPFTTYKWEVDGKTIQWIAPEHCMVLMGYDLDKSIAIISDPQRGIVEYDLETVKSRYKALYSQCVVIKEHNPKYPPTTATADEQ